MKRLIILLPLFLLGCDAPQPENATATTKLPWDNSVRTITHDDHEFVITFKSSYPTAIIHHPGCKCAGKP